MKKGLILFVIFITSASIFAQSDKEKAYNLGMEGIKYIDEEKYDSAIQKLKEAAKLDKDNFIYLYEIGYAYYLKKDYENSLKYYKEVIEFDDATDQCYQMLGNVYDATGDSGKAIETYNKGLEKFPNSGRLYLEKGNVYWNRNKFESAIPFYEQGIEADPEFSSNYYRATLIYCNSEIPLWGIIYGEIFMNLERNTERTEEISKLLFDTYKSAININSEEEAKISFNRILKIDDNARGLPFSFAFETAMLKSIIPLMKNNKKEITLSNLNDIRINFINFWYNDKTIVKFPVVTFKYMRKIQGSGFLDVYNRWIFMMGAEEEFKLWSEANADLWENFVKWFVKNKIEITQENKFLSKDYD